MGMFDTKFVGVEFEFGVAEECGLEARALEWGDE
jgi:hypothetical protein